VDWFFYRNGVLAEEGATSVTVGDSDRIWWDHHDWGAVMDVPAVVGAFPEPMRSGYEGERLPTRVECIEPEADACDVTAERLGQAGILAARGRVRGSLSAETIRILVGPYAKLRADEAVGQLERGCAPRRLRALRPRRAAPCRCSTRAARGPRRSARDRARRRHAVRGRQADVDRHGHGRRRRRGRGGRPRGGRAGRASSPWPSPTASRSRCPRSPGAG
jgi:hypothetical protein